MNGKPLPLPTTERNTLKDMLPTELWRILARNGIKTFEEARECYPEELLQMPEVGPRTFRRLEAFLSPDQCYIPDFREGLKHDAIDGNSKYRPFMWRVLMELKMYDKESIEPRN